MPITRIRRLFSLLAGYLFLTVLAVAPAHADVDCGDLATRTAAQSYYAAHRLDADRLDGDGDGRACERNVPTNHTDLGLLGLGVLVGGALLGSWVLEGARARARLVARGVRVERGLMVTTPFAAVGHKHGLVAAAITGSPGDLARALRLVPSADRMHLLESHAAAHGTTPQRVLDALAGDDRELSLQRWALVGFGPASHVRLMHCSCVGGLRNFRLQLNSDGVRSWSCTTCHLPARVNPRG